MARSHLMWVTLVSSLSCLTVMYLGHATAQTVLPNACVDCHGSESKFPVRGVRGQYVTSGHRTLGNASYANADDCQGCHTNEGFIQRVKTGKVDTKKFVSNPSEIGCFTCHAPHDSGNFSLRTVAKVALANGQVWVQSEANQNGYLRDGSSVTIKRAALGSYKLVSDTVSTRVRRLQ